jgi:hypothetical protein
LTTPSLNESRSAGVNEFLKIVLEKLETFVLLHSQVPEFQNSEILHYALDSNSV